MQPGDPTQGSLEFICLCLLHEHVYTCTLYVLNDVKVTREVCVRDKDQSKAKQHKPNPKAVLSQEIIATLGGIQTHDLQRSRLSALPLSYQGSSAG